MLHWIRRTVIFLFWPSIDLIITFFANFMLVRFDTTIAVIGTGITAMILNLVFLHLLYFETDLQKWVHKRAGLTLTLGRKFQTIKYAQNAIILFVYTISGPVMAGAPLIWLLGIKGKRAYALVFLGTLINSLVWVVGIYNMFWFLVREVMERV